MAIDLTDSVLAKSLIVSSKDQIVIPVSGISGFENSNVLVLYIKSKNIIQVMNLGDIQGSKVINMVLTSRNEDMPMLSIKMGREFFNDKNIELIWTSGVCTPSKQEKMDQGLEGDEIEEKEEGCIWEGFIKVPVTMKIESIKKKIRDVDEKGIASNIKIQEVAIATG